MDYLQINFKIITNNISFNSESVEMIDHSVEICRLRQSLIQLFIVQHALVLNRAVRLVYSTLDTSACYIFCYITYSLLNFAQSYYIKT